MPLPPTRTVTGLYTNPVTGAPASGSVVFTPVPHVWTDTNGNQVLAGSSEVTLVAGAFSQPLVPTDTPAVFPTAGKLWRIEQRLTGQPIRSWHFELVSGGSSIDITDLVELDPEPPPFVPEGTAGGDLTGSYPSPSLRNTQTARDHLGLGSSATRDVGTAAGTVAAGDDSRIVGALQRAGGTMTGELVLDFNGFNLRVGDDLAQSMSTGIVYGGTLSPNTATSITMAAGEAHFVDFHTDPLNPVARSVQFTAQTIALDDPLDPVTYFMLASNGSVVQKAGVPTRAERRTYAVLGRVVVIAGAIANVQTSPTLAVAPMNHFDDLVQALSVFRVQGVELSPNGPNLSFNTSAGELFNVGANFAVNRADPNVSPITAKTVTPFRYVTQNAVVDVAPRTVLDPDLYDVGGTPTVVGGGSGRATVQRVFVFPTQNVFVQLGQTVYNNVSEAVAGIASSPFVTHPDLLGGGILAGFIVMARTCTSLADTVTARFVSATKFGDVGASSAGSLVGTDNPGATRSAYKLVDEPVTNSIVLQNDDHLSMTVSANGIYTIDMYLDSEADPAADLALGFTFPAGASISWTEAGPSLGNTNNIASPKLNRNTGATTSTIGVIAAGTAACPRGVLRVGATAGTLQFTWAQAVASATPTILKAGSWLKVHRIA